MLSSVWHKNFTVSFYTYSNGSLFENNDWCHCQQANIISYRCDELMFFSCGYEPCFFVELDSIGVMLISLYVVDLLFAWSSTYLVVRVKQEFFQRLEKWIWIEGKICFRLEIARDRNKLSIKICQSAYALEVFERFEIQDREPSTPTKTKFCKAIYNGDFFCSTEYWHAIGSLMYLMNCLRHYIAFSVCRLLQYMEILNAGFSMYVKPVLHYIWDTTK